MKQEDKLTLLRRYVRDRDEDAFREIVASYLGLVESTALRRVNNDAASARDIAQIVFTDLARQADRLSSGILLGSWLYKHTCFVASKLLRSEQRRLAREKEASQMLANDPDHHWAELAPFLDSAILELSADDQNAIILRFFENQNLRSIGASLKISDDAAQKRVQRALEKLRDALHSRGISMGVPALAALLLSNCVLPATAASVAAVATAAFAGVAPASFLTGITALFMTKTAAVVALTCVSALVAVALFHPKQPPDRVTAGEVIRPQTARVNSADIKGAPPRERPIPGATLVDEILKKLEIGLHAVDEQTIIDTLRTFWTQYDSVSPQEQIRLRRAITPIIALWKNASVPLKKTILGTLERFRPSTHEIVDLYLEAYDTDELSHEALGGIMFAGPFAAPATDRLIDQLKRNHGVNDTTALASSDARMALEALGNIGPAASAAVPLLQQLMTDTNILYRVIGAKAYLKITQDTETVLPVLLNALTQDNSFWAAEILGQMGDAAVPALETLEKIYSSNAVDSTRLYAYQAIRQIAPSRTPDPDFLIDQMQNGRRISQVHAIQMLWDQFRDPDQILPTLKQLAADAKPHGMPEFDLITIYGILGEMGPRGAEALPYIQKVLQDSAGIDNVRIAATNAWQQIAPDRPVPSVRK